MFILKKRIFFPIVLSFICLQAYSEIRNDLKIENIKNTDGLVNNHVLCSFEDSRGIMWFGTYSGVQAYDGNQLTLFNEDEYGNELFTNHVVNCISEDKEHNLWFGTEYGLNKFNTKTKEIKQYILDEEDSLNVRNNYIKSIVIDEDGIIWLGTYGGGIFSFDEVTSLFTNYKDVFPEASLTSSNLVNSLFIDNKGFLWISTENRGIYVLDRKKRSVVTHITEKFSDYRNMIFNCVFQDYYGNYWIGTWDNGLIKYNINTNEIKVFNKFKNLNETNHSNVRSIEQTDKNFLWIATYGDGLFKFNTITEKYIKIELLNTDEKNTKQDYIWNLYKDNKENVWISTFGSGVFVISKDRNRIPEFKLIDKNNTRISISSFVEDQDDKLWIGTYTSGIYVFNINSGEYEKFTMVPGLDSRINTLFSDRNNNIWVGTEIGLYKISPNRKSYKYYLPKGENTNSNNLSNVSAVTEDKDGNIWIGLWGGGVNVLKNDQLGIPNTQKVIYKKYCSAKKGGSLTNGIIWRLFKDSRGNIWITSPGRLTCYNADKETFKSFEIYAVSSLCETESGNIWVSSMGNGIYLLDKNGNQLKFYDEEDGFPSNTLSGLMLDSRDRLWVGTGNGIAFLNSESGVVTNYDKSYGIGFNEVNLNAYLKTSSGKMVYGGNEGFNIFIPEELGLQTFDWQIYFNRIKVLYESNESIVDTTFVSERDFCVTDSVNLKSDSKMITINFSAINFFNAEGVKYAYCLEGFDTQWNLTDAKNRQAVYTNLQPGKYLFKVKASYNAKNWGIQQASLYIDIKRPITKMLWFRIFIVLISVIVIVGITRYKFEKDNKRLIKQNELLTNSNLKKEQELLRLQNEMLNSSVKENQKNIASLAFTNLNSIDKMDTVYRNLKEIERGSSSGSQRIIQDTIKLFEQDTESFSETNDPFETSFNLAYDDFQKRLSIAYPKLTHKDLRICAYIRMNKDNKTIAQQLNITIGSLETSRYRIRKKIVISPNVNLNDFLIKF